MKGGDFLDLSPLTVGVVLSLTAGFADILFLDRTSLATFWSSGILIWLAASSVFVLLIYLVLYYSFGRFLIRVFKLHRQALAISLAFLVGVSCLLLSLRLSIPGSFGLNLFQLSIPPVVVLFASVVMYFATEYFINKGQRVSEAKAFFVAFPFLLAEVAISGTMTNGSMNLLVALVLFLFTAWIFYRFRLTVIPETSLYGLILLVFGIPFLQLSSSQNPAHGELPRRGRNNKIKRVVLISIDTLRSDAISAYNRNTRPTPNMDRLASESVLFRNAISEAPWTLPAIGSIMTGVSPPVHLATEMNSQIPASLPVLAEYMQKAGYRTAAIGRNPHLVRNFFRGFQFYEFFPKSRISGLGGFALHTLLSKAHTTDISTTDLTNMAQEWIEKNEKQDFFLWLHYFDPHMPYTPPKGFLSGKSPSSRIGKKCPTSVIEGVRSGFFVPTESERQWIKNLYLGEVQYVDNEIGKFINGLKKKQLYDSTLIILTSDHGEEFWEHGSFEHAHTVYNELLRVPLIIKLPKSSHMAEIDAAVATSAVLPTLLDLCAIEFAPDVFSSQSLTTLWNTMPVFDENPILSTGQLYFEQKFSLQFKGVKYIEHAITNGEELYDLKLDPGEQVSIISQDQERLEQMRNLLREQKRGAREMRSRYRITESTHRELSPQDRETLRSLGYIQ